MLAGGAAASGLPFYAIICLPILFAAGMSLFDTIDGAFMNFAYGWAFSKPVRKIFYNLTVTGLSVAVALVIGSIELLAVLAEKLSLTGGVWDVVDRARPQPRRLHRRRPVRADVGARARRLALRAHRAALERRRAAAVTTAPERRPLAFARRRRDPRDAARGGPPRIRAGDARARGAVRGRRARVGRSTSWPSAGLERTSVYRNLERLEALGVVSHVHVGHGPGLYALVRGADREYLTCDRCGRVTTLDPAALDGVRAALHAEFGHHARFSHFPIHGTCGSCADAEEHHEHGAHPHPHTH